MALRLKGGRAPVLDQQEYDMYWKEYRSIEESRPAVSVDDHDDEHSKEPVGECEQEIQWLREAGFDAIVKKYKDSKEIDPNDVDFENITGSLTRKQAEAVRKRIDTLNQSLKKELGVSVAPSKQSYYPADVRTIFPAKTTGLPSNAHQTRPTRPQLTRKSYSEGLSILKQTALDIDEKDNDKGYRHSHSTVMLSEIAEDKYAGSYLHPENANMARRASEEVRVKAGVQQARHPHGGSVFYLTATTKQELFNTAEKTKESVVDDINGADLKSLSISPPDTSPDSFHEVPVDCPEEVPVDVPETCRKPVRNGRMYPDGNKPFREPQFPRLPNYTLTKDELGVTTVQDISPQDMEKVRSLALIELTALFDSHGLALHRRKPVKRKVKESGIFGVPLTQLVQEDKLRNEHTTIPLFYLELVRVLEEKGLREEGLLRVPGNAGRVKAIREEVEETYNEGAFMWEDRRPHDCATLLKQFLRELPFPLLTHEYQSTFASVERIRDRKQQLQALNLLILLLPPVHRDCLKILVHFLSRVCAHEKQNKMGLNSVAMIMAPNLFLWTNKSPPSVQEIKQAQGTVNIVRMLIKYQAILWTIPGFMVMQVRYLYEAEGNKKAKDAKAVRKLLAKRARDGISGTPLKKHSLVEPPLDFIDADYESNIIRVKAPMLNKVLMAIQLTDCMSAGDIVSKFRRRPSPTDELIGDRIKERDSSESTSDDSYRNCLNPHDNNKFASDNYFLFEAGGNIGERCLDHDTNVKALRKVNPHAEWIVKPRDHYLNF